MYWLMPLMLAEKLVRSLASAPRSRSWTGWLLLALLVQIPDG